MKVLISLSLIFISLFNGFGQCNENSEVRTLLIGDSWAFFMGVDQTLNTVFENWGHSDIEYHTNVILAENGAETTDFLAANKQQAIIQAFDDYPNADHVHLSIGGNDFLGNWQVSFTQQETDDLKQQVIDSLLAVIDFIQSVKPGVHIVWSGYVYTNFDEVISNFLLPSNHPFYGTWEGMEFPTNEQINEQTIAFLNEVEAVLDQDPKVTFINAPGLMQNVFGQEDPLEVAPFGTYQPGEAPLPEGFSDYPSPQNSMRDYGLTKDCFHLSAAGYRAMMSYQMQKYYHKAFMSDIYYLAENDQSTGSVTSNNNVDTNIFIGNSNGEDYAGLLTFDTSSALDTTILSARLFLKRKNQIGGNPITDSLIVRIKSGGFGTDLAIEASDFIAAADESATPCLFGDNSNENWIRLDLPSELYPYILNNDKTQFMILAPNTNEALMEFYGPSDPDFAPVLDLEFDGDFELNIPETQKASSTITVFPNPAQNMLNVKSSHDKVVSVIVYDLLGNKLLERSGNKNYTKLDISDLISGVYVANIYTSKGLVIRKFIKN
jgi:lysophospholipase L1-like esterase